MSQIEREIVRQAPTHPGMQVEADDKWVGRWLMNMGVPISLAEYSGSRFIGKFANDVLPAKKPVYFAPHMARSTGPYEHRAHYGFGADMGPSVVDEMLSVPVNSVAHNTAAALSSYDNNPKFCAYTLMRNYERRGLCLFEGLGDIDEDEFKFLLNLIIPVQVEKEWTKTKRTVLNHTFQGPFLDQYKQWLGTSQLSMQKNWFNSNIGRILPEGLKRPQSDKYTLILRTLRTGVSKAWAWENTVLNTSEQQIRRYRNGHRGKEFYDAQEISADEIAGNPIPPLDLICLVDTNRTPIDLSQVAAADAMSKATNEGLVTAMESFGEKLAGKMQQGVSAADIEAIIERRMAAQREEWEAREAEWQQKLDALQPST